MNRRLGWDIEDARDFEFEHNGDRLGWIEGNGNWNFTLFIQNGRVKDTEDYKLKTALREIAEMHTGDFRLSPNQNLVIANVTPEKKMKSKLSLISMVLQMVRTILDYAETHGMCSLSNLWISDGRIERYLPSLISKIEDLLG